MFYPSNTTCYHDGVYIPYKEPVSHVHFSKLKKFFKNSTYYLFRECSISLSVLPLIKGERKEKRGSSFFWANQTVWSTFTKVTRCTADWTAAWRPEGLKPHHKNFSAAPFKWTSRACFWDQSTLVSNKPDNKQSWHGSALLPPKGLKNLSQSCEKPNLQGILFMCLICYHWKPGQKLFCRIVFLLQVH